MTQEEETQIIRELAVLLDSTDSISLKQFVSEKTSSIPTLSQQKKLAKKLVKVSPCVSQIRDSEIIVSKNTLIETTDKRSDSGLLIVVLALIIAAIAGYFLFKVFLPKL